MDTKEEDYETSQRRQYVVKQRNSGINPGDTVTVMRASETYEAGWKNTWNYVMDSFIGKTYTVLCIREVYGITLRDTEEGHAFDFPYFVLSKTINTHSIVTISVKDISCVIEIPTEMLTAIKEKEKVTITNVTFK